MKYEKLKMEKKRVFKHNPTGLKSPLKVARTENDKISTKPLFSLY